MHCLLHHRLVQHLDRNPCTALQHTRQYSSTFPSLTSNNDDATIKAERANEDVHYNGLTDDTGEDEELETCLIYAHVGASEARLLIEMGVSIARL